MIKVTLHFKSKKDNPVTYWDRSITAKNKVELKTKVSSRKKEMRKRGFKFLKMTE